jgi:hypothetical protein
MKNAFFVIALAAAAVSCSNEAASTEGTTVDTIVVSTDTTVAADTTVAE